MYGQRWPSESVALFGVADVQDMHRDAVQLHEAHRL